MTIPRGNAGFTIVEMIVAMLIATVLMAATYQVLVTTQRVSTVQTEQVLVQQTLRAGVDILSQELREASVSGGDVLLADEDRVEFRALRSFGIVCVVASPTVVVLPVGRNFRGQPDVFIFADGDPDTATDDTWYQATLLDLPQGEDCPGPPIRPGQLLVLGGVGTFYWDRIRQGAAIRSFQAVAYHEDTVDGEPYLVRTTGTTTVPLVGPLDPAGGLTFEYLAADGTVLSTPATPSSIHRVRITVRAASAARMSSVSDPVAGELTTTVYLRN